MRESDPPGAGRTAEDKTPIPPAATILLLLLFTCPALRPLLDRDLFIAHDVFFHITHLHQFERALGGGGFYPRWFPDVFEGYGAPVGVFYPLLPYYVAEIPRLLGAGITASWQWFVAAGFLLSGLFQYLWARRMFGEAGGFVAAVAYVYWPYHLVDAYVRGAFPEFMGFVCFPLAAWGLSAAAARPGPRRVALAALPTGALALTHFPSAVLFLPVAVGIGIVTLRRREALRGGIALAAGLALGVGIAAVAWLPFWAELNSVGLSEKSHHAFVQFESHYVSFQQIFSRYWGFGGSLPPPLEDGMSFQVGWVHLGLAALGVFGLIRGGTHRRLGVLLGLLAVLGIFMMLRPSDFIWSTIPLIRQVQFPWRVLSPLGFIFATLAGAALARDLGGLSARWPRWAAPTAALCAGGLLLLYSLPYCVASYRGRPVDPARYPEAYRGALWPKDLAPRVDRFLREEDLSEVAYEDPYYLPVHRKAPPGERPASRVGPAEGGGKVMGIEESPGKLHFHTESAEEHEYLVHIFHYPGWTATVDGNPIEIGLHEETGGMRLTVPGGRHEVRLRFGTTPARTAAGVATLICLSAALILLFLRGRGTGGDLAPH